MQVDWKLLLLASFVAIAFCILHVNTLLRRKAFRWLLYEYFAYSKVVCHCIAT